jgi:hydroxymethylbilane synthase
VIAAVPEREDPRDVLVSASGGGLAGLARGARVATGSLRRAAFVRHGRADLKIVPMRGNVDTRLAKWRGGEADALVLARAGLARLGLDLPEARDLSPEEMLPAIGQGALAIEMREDGAWRRLVAELDDPRSAAAIAAERAVLRALGGDCTTPIAAHGTVVGSMLRLQAVVADLEGRRLIRAEREGSAADAALLGREAGEELLSRGGREILAELRR